MILCHYSVKWIKRLQIHIGMVAFNKFFWVYIFAARKKIDATYLVEKLT